MRCMSLQNIANAPLKSRDVMPRLGFKDRKSFWEAVHREGIPHTRISTRNIVFFENSLVAWIASRSTGRVS